MDLQLASKLKFGIGSVCHFNLLEQKDVAGLSLELRCLVAIRTLAGLQCEALQRLSQEDQEACSGAEKEWFDGKEILCVETSEILDFDLFLLLFSWKHLANQYEWQYYIAQKQPFLKWFGMKCAAWFFLRI